MRLLVLLITGGMVLFLNGCIMSSGVLQRKTTASESNMSSGPSKERRTAKNVHSTFLDTLNVENEIVLGDNDFEKHSITAPKESGLDNSGAESLFRIQVFASNRIETVREQKKELEKYTSEQVLIGYDAPYYKLYTGGFARRQDAQSVLIKLKKSGYPDAWITTVKDKP